MTFQSALILDINNQLENTWRCQETPLQIKVQRVDLKIQQYEEIRFLDVRVLI